jgi:predicted DNA binding CopG/RHH family protein
MESKDAQLITLRLSNEELKRIKEAQCKALETNRAKFIRQAIEEKCESVLGPPKGFAEALKR